MKLSMLLGILGSIISSVLNTVEPVSEPKDTGLNVTEVVDDEFMKKHIEDLIANNVVRDLQDGRISLITNYGLVLSNENGEAAVDGDKYLGGNLEVIPVGSINTGSDLTYFVNKDAFDNCTIRPVTNGTNKYNAAIMLEEEDGFYYSIRTDKEVPMTFKDTTVGLSHNEVFSGSMALCWNRFEIPWYYFEISGEESFDVEASLETDGINFYSTVPTTVDIEVSNDTDAINVEDVSVDSNGIFITVEDGDIVIK